jgi:uncharacterized protein YndB with AHSA1/START domain
MIEKSVVLRCPPARAFTLFTERAGDWWPADRRHTKDPSSTITIEPLARGGRFYERAGEGTEVELGKVRVYDPPTRLLLDWYPGTSAAAPTVVEVHFEPTSDGTRVTVQHREGPASAELYRERVPRYVSSWDKVFEAWAAAADA